MSVSRARHPGVAAPPVTSGALRHINIRGHQDHGEHLPRPDRVPDHPHRSAPTTCRVRGQPDGVVVFDSLVGRCWFDAVARAHILGTLAPIQPRQTYILLRCTTDGRTTCRTPLWGPGVPAGSRLLSHQRHQERWGRVWNRSLAWGTSTKAGLAAWLSAQSLGPASWACVPPG